MKEFELQKKYNWELAHEPISKTEFYEIDLTTSIPVVEVGTVKGIIEVKKLDSVLPTYLQPSFVNPTNLWINNSKMLLTVENRDNVYAQITPYYKQLGDDNFIPYVIATGFYSPNGLGLNIYNANPALIGADQCKGAFYLYYELYTK